MSIQNYGWKILERLWIAHQLPQGDEEKRKYIADLKRLEEPQRFIFTHFYGNLDVLDNKTNSLIQFSSVLVAIHIAVIGYAEGAEIALGWSMILGAVSAFCAAILFLSIETVHWSSPEDIANEEEHALRLLTIRNRRTIQYRVGWQLSVLSTLLLAISVMMIARAL
jgi:hypothetical protein